MARPLKNQHPSFPARTVMKIITDAPGSAEESSAQQEREENTILGRLEAVFKELLLEPAEWRRTYSKGNSYISFTTEVTIQNRDQLHILYQKLGELPEVRYIL